MIRELQESANETASVPKHRHRGAVHPTNVRQRAHEIAVGLAGMHEQIRIRRQSVSQMNAGQRRATAKMKRHGPLARLEKGELTRPNDAGIETAGHEGYSATFAASGGHGRSGSSNR